MNRAPKGSESDRGAGHIVVTFRVAKEEDEDEFTASCTELELSSQGATVDDALAAVREAVELYLNVIEQEGERQRVFKELGIQVILGNQPDADADVRVPVGVIVSRGSFEVPVSA